MTPWRILSSSSSCAGVAEGIAAMESSHGVSAAVAATRAAMVETAEAVLRLGVPRGGNEIELAHLGRMLAALVLTFDGRAQEDVKEVEG